MRTKKKSLTYQKHPIKTNSRTTKKYQVLFLLTLKPRNVYIKNYATHAMRYNIHTSLICTTNTLVKFYATQSWRYKIQTAVMSSYARSYEVVPEKHSLFKAMRCAQGKEWERSVYVTGKYLSSYWDLYKMMLSCWRFSDATNSGMGASHLVVSQTMFFNRLQTFEELLFFLSFLYTDISYTA